MQYVPGQTPAPGWNTFGPVFQPATPAPALHHGALQPKGHVPQTVAVVLLVLLVTYLVLYGVLRWKLPADSPGRKRADRWLWCWSSLYDGQACCFYNVIFSPVVLTIHAIRIYLPNCLYAYCWRMYWIFGGCCSSFYTDQDFPPQDSSLGEVGGDNANAKSGKSGASTVTWVRAMDFCRQSGAKPSHPTLGDSKMCLFEGRIEAQDILQGALGDCWLLAAMATLAEHEGAIDSLFMEHCVQPHGQYHIKLFDPQVKQWTVIKLDDFVPCKPDSRDPLGVARARDGMPEALYAHPHGKETWVMMLEKAFAKLCGSYAATEAGITEWAISAMTGGNAWRYERSSSEKSWERLDLVTQKSEDKRACAFKPTDEKHDDEDFFQLLRHYHRQGAVLCCGGVKEAGQKQGLVPKHAFSLLQVRAVPLNWHSNEYFRMVQIRNPWGTGEWKGSWCDGSPLWDKYPHVKTSLGFSSKDDGTYWMQWAVHGMSGTWAFDSGGLHSTDYVYKVEQSNGAPDDYYICDSRRRPQHCALLGGNVKQACAAWYDPRQCDFCEDLGDELKCEVRGWNHKEMKWSRVPIYPRDLLGELYRGEWKDVWMRPTFASVRLKKAGFQGKIKKLPMELVTTGPGNEALMGKGIAPPPFKIAEIAGLWLPWPSRGWRKGREERGDFL